MGGGATDLIFCRDFVFGRDLVLRLRGGKAVFVGGLGRLRSPPRSTKNAYEPQRGSAPQGGTSWEGGGGGRGGVAEGLNKLQSGIFF